MSDYIRRDAGKAILDALQTLGGSASRNKLKQSIANNPDSGFTYEDVFEPTVSKNGNKYIPFNFDFNFGINNLFATGYVEQPIRTKDIVLTEKGRSHDHSSYPTDKEQRQITRYWKEKNKKNLKKKQITIDDPTAGITNEEDAAGDSDNWKTDLIENLKDFSPRKFESFSRLLISKMGILVDDKRGKIMSRDHGIDGFGYFESDEFRTSRVAIQAKRYTENAVSEPEIDKFKGVMDSFNAEYGIFITTSHFTESAKNKAVQGSKSVTLIDGSKIADLVEKYELHVTPIKSFTLDDYYVEKD